MKTSKLHFPEHISHHLMFFVAHMLHLDFKISEKFLIEKHTFRQVKTWIKFEFSKPLL